MSSIPVRMLNELQYCERLYHFMHVQGLFDESRDTVEGTMQHRRAERRRRPSDTGREDIWDIAPQSLHLGTERLGIVGKLDALKYDDGAWIPVEAKHSSSPSRSDAFRVGEWLLQPDAWPNDQIQLCALGLLLEENGYPVNYGQLFYRGNRKIIRVPLTEDLRAATASVIERAHQLESAELPAPLLDSDKCFRCSLNTLCLPDETRFLNERSQSHAGHEPQKPRNIVPSRDDLGILNVSEPGTRLGKRGDEVIIDFPAAMNRPKMGIPLKDIAQFGLFGNVQISTQLLHACLERGIPVMFHSGSGRLVGMASGLITKNARMRQMQYRRLEDESTCLTLASGLIRAKITNQRTLLRRNGAAPKAVLSELSDLAKQCVDASTSASLLGMEGRAARLYFTEFPSMVRAIQADGAVLMNGRNRRPPKDPVNSLLSFGYSLLVRDLCAAIVAVGLEPMYGFYHVAEPGRPALALDLMEPFRPLIVDSTVIRVLNTEEVHLRDFYIGNDSCALNARGRKAFLSAYERRMNEKATHPVFGYRLSYRRMLELEVRILAKFLEGDISEYQPMVTR